MADLLTDAKIATTIYDLAKKEGWIDKLMDVFRTRHKVLVLGTSGTGKTQLVQSLKSLLPPTISRVNRSTTKESEKLSIDSHPFHFVIVPGEDPKNKVRHEAMRESMKDLAGIINVVSYGYHEGDTSETEVFDGNGLVRSDFLSKGQSEEIEILNEWTNMFGDRIVTKWLRTVVTKADLWWDNRDAVLSHYKTGNYFKALGSAQSLDLSVLAYCSEVHRFYDRGAVSAHFDDKNRAELRSRLLTDLVKSVAK